MSVQIRCRAACAGHGSCRRAGSGASAGRGLLVAVMLLASSFSPLSAQVGFGMISGLSRSSFTGSGAIEVGNRTSFLIGAMGDVPFGETFSIRPELYVSAKGAGVNTALGDYQLAPHKVFRLSYVQMPILAQLRTAPGGAIRPHIFGGVSLGALLGCELEEENCDDIEQIDHRSVDIGVVVGGEVEWRDLGIGARYDAGVRAMEASTPGSEIYNGVLSFTVRYLFRR